MRKLRTLEALGVEGKPLAMAIGFFDGVHLGHQGVIRRAVSTAREMNGEAWVLTFDPHPLQLIAPRASPPLLTPLPHKLRLLDQLGVQGCVVLPFNHDLHQMEAETFAGRLAAIGKLRRLVVGANWSFGRERRGTPELLLRLAEGSGMRVDVVAAVHAAGGPVSSTRIREVIQNGGLCDARRMLGRPFSLLGKVVRGRGIGRTLGFPTINLRVENEVLPPAGVYAAQARTEDRTYSAAAYIGTRPTFEESQHSPPVVEAHLLDSGIPDLYGREIELSFLKNLRSETRFESPAQLAAQLAVDARAAQQHLAASKHAAPERVAARNKKQ